MSIISGITCKNGTALELTAPVSSGDTSIVNIYNTGNYTAKLDGNLTLGNGINSGNFSALNATINGTTVINEVVL